MTPPRVRTGADLYFARHPHLSVRSSMGIRTDQLIVVNDPITKNQSAFEIDLEVALVAENTRAAASAYVAAGVSILPVRADGSKAPTLPAGQVEQYRTRSPTPQELTDWYARGPRGIGVIGGPASGNLV